MPNLQDIVVFFYIVSLFIKQPFIKSNEKISATENSLPNYKCHHNPILKHSNVQAPPSGLSSHLQVISGRGSSGLTSRAESAVHPHRCLTPVGRRVQMYLVTYSFKKE